MLVNLVAQVLGPAFPMHGCVMEKMIVRKVKMNFQLPDAVSYCYILDLNDLYNASSFMLMFSNLLNSVTHCVLLVSSLCNCASLLVK